MITKHQTLLLSLVSVISSFSIAGMTVFLVVVDSSVNLIINPCSALKIISVLSAVFFVVKYMSSYIEDSPKEKAKTHMMMLLKGTFLLLIASVVFHCIAVLFGAPVYTSVPETFHFALLLTILTVLPCYAVAGLKFDKLVNIFTSEREPGLETVVYLTTIGAILGAWLGAVPIPLDWDRPWQTWPVSCSIGCISGYSLGLFLSSLYLPHEYKAAAKNKSF